VGLIRTPELAEALLQKNSADLIAIGRQALFNPFWPHQAAEQLGANEAFENWPRPYAWWLSKWKTGLLANGESLNNWRK
jgi:2,4-dienoyl-CoA reductase-like NADH-dependent reductase (Old Yellow Enzyme family)